MVTVMKREIMKINVHDILNMENHALGISNFSYFFYLRGIHFDMASETTNSARYGSQAREIIKRVYNVCREEKMGSCHYIIATS